MVAYRRGHGDLLRHGFHHIEPGIPLAGILAVIHLIPHVHKELGILVPLPGFNMAVAFHTL